MSQLGSVLDTVPPQVWLVIYLASLGFGPASYVWQHMAHAPNKRDITLPPEDLSWRSDKQLYRCLAILAGLLGVGVFIFTPLAEDFAKSDAFVPSLLGAIGSYALSTVVGGWRNRRIEPMLRGFSQSYARHDRPVGYWASLCWNAVLGSALIAVSLGVWHDNVTPRCDDSDDKTALIKALETCNTMLAENGLGEEQRADLLGARGRVHYRLGYNDRALADYSEALRADPTDSYALYNRGLAYSRTGELLKAIDDFSASLSLRPNNNEAYLERGNAYLNAGYIEKAIKDFTTLHQRDREYPYALANRGIAYAWRGDRELAERDFATVDADDPGWLIVLRGRAVLAMHRRDQDSAIDYLSQALSVDPNDTFSLRMRANIYWEAGQHDLARDDDDRSMAIEAKLMPERLAVRVDR